MPGPLYHILAQSMEGGWKALVDAYQPRPAHEHAHGHHQPKLGEEHGSHFLGRPGELGSAGAQVPGPGNRRGDLGDQDCRAHEVRPDVLKERPEDQLDQHGHRLREGEEVHQRLASERGQLWKQRRDKGLGRAARSRAGACAYGRRCRGLWQGQGQAERREGQVQREQERRQGRKAGVAGEACGRDLPRRVRLLRKVGAQAKGLLGQGREGEGRRERQAGRWKDHGSGGERRAELGANRGSSVL